MPKFKYTARLAVTAGLCASMMMGGMPVSAIAEELQTDAAFVEVAGSPAPTDTKGVATEAVPTAEEGPVNVTSDEPAAPVATANDLSADSADNTEAEAPGTPAGYVVDEATGNVTIKDLEAFKYFREQVNGGNTFAKKTVTLDANIDLGNEEWTPIGHSQVKNGAAIVVESRPFSGTFDGAGFVISNLKISAGISTNYLNKDKGLFGYTSGATIKNLTIENVNITGGLYVASLIANTYTVDTSNITVCGDVNISGYAYVGGILGGALYGDANKLTVDANAGSSVTANSQDGMTYVGGVIGQIGEGLHVISNIQSNISVNGSTAGIGGISGGMQEGNTFTNCVVKEGTPVTCTSANPKYHPFDTAQTGGIVGLWVNSGTRPLKIENCTFGGTIKSVSRDGVDYSGFVKNNVMAGGSWQDISKGSNMLTIIEGGVTTVVPGSTKVLQEALKNPVDGQTIKLAGDVTCDVVIPKGVTATIDLAGHAITNDKGDTITNNGTLTIKDTVGGGVVDAVTPGSIAFVNNGTATIENGKFTRSKEFGTPGAQGANTNYTVNNKGELTVKGGEIVNTSTGSSLIRNGQNSTLNIEGGRLSNVFNAVKNEETGELKISGGVIESEDQTVQNWGVADISGGEFSGSVMAWGWEDFESSLTIGGDAVVNGDVVAVKYKDYESNPGITINGGTVNGEIFKATSDGSAPAEKVDSSHKGSEIVVNGGIFSDPSAGDFLAPDAGLQQDENGNFKPVEVALVLDEAVVEGAYTFDIKGGTAKPLTEGDLLGLVSVNAVGYTVSVDTTNLDALNEAIESVDTSESFDFVYTATKDEASAARTGDLTTTVTISLVDTGDPTVKPEPVDKGALSQLIGDAKQLSTEGKSDKVVAEYKAALAEAVAVLEDDEATQDEVDAAFVRLSAALTALAADQGDQGEGEKPGDKPGSDDEQKPGKDEGDKDADSDTLPTTGDDSMLPIAVAGVAGAAAVAAGVAVAVKRRKQ